MNSSAKFEKLENGNLEYTQVVDIGSYASENILINLEDDNILTVSVETPEIGKKYLKRLEIPKEMDINNLKTFYTKDNKLVIRAPIMITNQSSTTTTATTTTATQLQQQIMNNNNVNTNNNNLLSNTMNALNRLQAELHSRKILTGALSNYSLTQPPDEQNAYFFEKFEIGRNIEAGDINVRVQDGMLYIQAERQMFLSNGEKTSTERYYKEVLLPPDVNEEKLTSKLINGVLILSAPKRNNLTINNSSLTIGGGGVGGRFNNCSLQTSGECHCSDLFDRLPTNKYLEEIYFDPIFNPQNIEIIQMEDRILIRGMANKLNPFNGRVHSSHNYRHEVQIPNTIDVTKMIIRWTESHKLIIDAPFKQANPPPPQPPQPQTLPLPLLPLPQPQPQQQFHHQLQQQQQQHSLMSPRPFSPWDNCFTNSMQSRVLHSPLLPTPQLDGNLLRNYFDMNNALGGCYPMNTLSFINNTTTTAATPAAAAMDNNNTVNSDNKYMVKLKLDSLIRPTDLNIFVDDGGVLHIEGVHEHDENGHHLKKTFKKQHSLPKGVNTDEINAFWLDGGYLQVEAPFKISLPDPNQSAAGGGGGGGDRIPVKVQKK